MGCYALASAKHPVVHVVLFHGSSFPWPSLYLKHLEDTILQEKELDLLREHLARLTSHCLKESCGAYGAKSLAEHTGDLWGV